MPVHTTINERTLRGRCCAGRRRHRPRHGIQGGCPPLPDEAKDPNRLPAPSVCPILGGPDVPEDERTPLWVGTLEREPRNGAKSEAGAGTPSERPALDWL